MSSGVTQPAQGQEHHVKGDLLITPQEVSKDWIGEIPQRPSYQEQGKQDKQFA